MAITYLCGYECGVMVVANTHINTASVGVTFSTTTFRSGTRALRLNPSAATVGAGYDMLPGSAVYVLRTYINVVSAPTTDAFLCGFRQPSGSIYFGLVYSSSDGKVYAGDSFNGTLTKAATGATLAAGWNRIDLRVDLSANPWLVDAQVDGVALAQYANAAAPDTLTMLSFSEFTTAETFDIFFDDTVCANTAGEYPIGAGKVTAHSPNRDGAHTGTGTNFQRGNAGDAITSAVTNAYLLVDDFPMSTAIGTSDHISQITSTPTQYVEIGFASTTTLIPPQAITAVIGAHKGSSAVAHAAWEWNDGGTTFRIQSALNTSGSSALEFVLNRFPASNAQVWTSRPAGGAWTSGAFNALLMRFGHSTDANPDVYWDEALIEAAFSNTGAGAVDLGNSTLVASGIISNITSNWVHLTPVVASI